MYGPLAGLLVASVRKGAAEKERGLQSRLCSQRKMLGLKWGEQNTRSRMGANVVSCYSQSFVRIMY